MRISLLAISFLTPIIIMTSCGSRASERVDYTLDWKGDGIGVEVEMTSRRDTVAFTFGSDAGGITDQMTWLQDLEATEGQVVVDSSKRLLSVIPKKGRASLSYVVRCTLPERYGSPGGCIMDVFRPDFDEEMIFTRSENLFIAPAGAYDIPAKVIWKSVPDYPVFCLYNPGEGTGPFEGKAGDVCESLIVGDPSLKVDSVMVDGNINYVVTALRKCEEYNRSALKDYFRAFYKSATEFWEEEYEEPYSMVIFPFRRNTFEVTGNGFSNGFMSRYDATADTVLTIGRRDVFTHEIGHKWIGADPAWFGEGFNEMQTGYQLVASGMDEPAYFATYFNIALAGLHKNPHRNATQAEADERFWDDGSYIWLLYWRGFSYAFQLAGLVEKATGEPNAWKKMMEVVKPFIYDFTPEKFLEAMSTLVDKERLERDYKTYILEGQDFVYNPEELPSGCEIIYLEDGTPQLAITDLAAFARHFEP